MLEKGETTMRHNARKALSNHECCHMDAHETSFVFVGVSWEAMEIIINITSPWVDY